jgi:hypothetical protein
VRSFEAYAEYDPVLNAYAGRVQVARDYLRAAGEDVMAGDAYRWALRERKVAMADLARLVLHWTGQLDLESPCVDLPSSGGTAGVSGLIAAANQLIQLAEGSETLLVALTSSLGPALDDAEASLVAVQEAVHVRTEAAYLRRRRALIIESFILAYRDALAAVVGRHHHEVRGLSPSHRGGEEFPVHPESSIKRKEDAPKTRKAAESDEAA